MEFTKTTWGRNATIKCNSYGVCNLETGYQILLHLTKTNFILQQNNHQSNVKKYAALPLYHRFTNNKMHFTTLPPFYLQ